MGIRSLIIFFNLLLYLNIIYWDVFRYIWEIFIFLESSKYCYNEGNVNIKCVKCSILKYFWEKGYVKDSV